MPKLSPILRRFLITLAVVAIIAARKADSFNNPQLWAEDGGLFLIEAETLGWGAIFKPYEGYQHLLPRIIAALGCFLPLAVVPVFYSSAALFATALTAWMIQSPRLQLPGAWVAALAIGAIPHTGEVYLTICNLQWVTALALFALTISEDAATRWQQVGDVTLLVIVGLTGPFVLLALPLFAWRAWRSRSRWSLVLFGGALAVAAIHAPSLWLRPPPADLPAWSPLRYFGLVGLRLWVSVFTGAWFPGLATCAAIAVVLPAGLAAAVWVRRRVLPGAGPLLVAAALVLAAAGLKSRPDLWSVDDLVNGDRYFFIPKVLVIWILAALASTSVGAWRGILSGLLIMPLVANAPRFVYPPAPPQNWRSYAEKIERGEPTLVPILPDGFSFRHPGRKPR